MMERMGWILIEEVKLLLAFSECPTSIHQLIMNVIAWNCQGTLKPGFQNHFRDLVQKHNPAIFVVMETRIGGVRAKGITDCLPFDGVIHTDTIEYTSGL